MYEWRAYCIQSSVPPPFCSVTFPSGATTPTSDLLAAIKDQEGILLLLNLLFYFIALLELEVRAVRACAIHTV